MIKSAPVEVKPLRLDSSLQFLKGVGPRRSDLFRRLGLTTLRDLVTHFPRRYEDRRAFLPIARLVPGQKATVRGKVAGASIFRARTGTVILQVAVKDATGSLTALWFNQPYMRRWFPLGQELILYGGAEQVGRRLQMLVPEFELISPERQSPSGLPAGQAGTVPPSLHMGRIVPIYPATSGLHQRELRTVVVEGLKALLPILTDPVPASLRERHSLLDLPTALKRIHFPPTPEAASAAQARLAFDELLCFQLALGIRRRALQGRPGISHQVGGEGVERWKTGLPFTLTPGQERTIQEIAQEMAAPRPMRRLVQGEVGSGKTAVAAYAIVAAVQSGCQAVVMAPTEVLARQHALTLTHLLAPVDISVGLLTSSLDLASRRQLAEGLKSGSLPVLVATHAALEPWVVFKRLGLVVIDEQQKFGVDQREAILKKGDHPDLLILTATPIPRTLALTLYGEMGISTIAERPAGRVPVKTLWIDSTRRPEAYAFVKKELEAGRQAYVVCPRIGSSLRGASATKQSQEMARNDVFSVSEMFKEYQQVFAGFQVGLLHGRMSGKEQKGIFSAFKAGDLQVLVATQLIEVGVDVANATVMVIEGAERFGLAQLHQLRGRVGRGKHEGICILMADPKDPSSVERLQTLVEVGDAFKIAEQDLRLRGPGQLLGKRQSGLPDLKCLQWACQGPWMEITKVEADSILQADPSLSIPKNKGLISEIEIRFPKLAESACG